MPKKTKSYKNVSRLNDLSKSFKRDTNSFKQDTKSFKRDT